MGMGNIYILAENESSNLIDVTDREPDKRPMKQFIVHGCIGIEKAHQLWEEMMPVKDIAERFCRNCGNYIDPETKTCGCEPQII